MSAELGSPHAAASAESPEVAVIVALGLETRALRARLGASGDGCRLSLHQCGPGRARAFRAAAAALAQGADALLSWGLAGGLAPAARCGAIVLPRRILGPEGKGFEAADPWRSRLAAELGRHFPVADGPLLSTGELLMRPADKVRAAASTGAVAVDMESAGVAEAAAAAAAPFVVLRVVADGPDDALPAGVEAWIDERGDRRLAPLLEAVSRPSRWRALCTLGRRYGRARRTFEAVAERLAPQGFLFANDALAS